MLRILEQLERELGYEFQDKNNLERALLLPHTLEEKSWIADLLQHLSKLGQTQLEKILLPTDDLGDPERLLAMANCLSLKQVLSSQKPSIEISNTLLTETLIRILGALYRDSLLDSAVFRKIALHLWNKANSPVKFHRQASEFLAMPDSDTASESTTPPISQSMPSLTTTPSMS